MLCDTGSGDVEQSPIWGLGNIGGKVDEVEISNVSVSTFTGEGGKAQERAGKEGGPDEINNYFNCMT